LHHLYGAKSPSRVNEARLFISLNDSTVSSFLTREKGPGYSIRISAENDYLALGQTAQNKSPPAKPEGQEFLKIVTGSIISCFD
jgi:hypothetical protein